MKKLEKKSQIQSFINEMTNFFLNLIFSNKKIDLMENCLKLLKKIIIKKYTDNCINDIYIEGSHICLLVVIFFLFCFVREAIQFFQ